MRRLSGQERNNTMAADFTTPVFTVKISRKNKAFALISMYGFPVALDSIKYLEKHNFKFFNSSQKEMDFGLKKLLLNNQKIIERIAVKNARRNKLQAWLRTNIIDNQPKHLCEIQFYEELSKALSTWNSKKELCPEKALSATFSFFLLKN